MSAMTVPGVGSIVHTIPASPPYEAFAAQEIANAITAVMSNLAVTTLFA